MLLLVDKQDEYDDIVFDAVRLFVDAVICVGLYVYPFHLCATSVCA